MLIRLTFACFLLALFVSCEAFFSFSSCRRISFTRGRFTLHVGTSPDGTPRNKPKKPRVPADENAGAKNEIEDNYKWKTVVRLRGLLKDWGLKLSGLKSELVGRLKKSDNAADVPKATNYDTSPIIYKSNSTTNQ